MQQELNLLDEALYKYVELHTTPEQDYLAALNRETWLKVLQPHMISGHLQGRILASFSQMLKPERILEIGTYTGYSALCLAEGLAENGVLHTIDINEELSDLVQSYIARANFSDKIICHIGEAAKIIPTLPDQFDLVFIDADKKNYGLYYDLVFDKVRPGGFILADNVLWKGKVTEASAIEKDKDLQRMMAFNDKVQNDSRVENYILPVRDGIMVARKR